MALTGRFMPIAYRAPPELFFPLLRKAVVRHNWSFDNGAEIVNNRQAHLRSRIVC